VIEANESQTSYSVEQADIFQYQVVFTFPTLMFVIKKPMNINIKGKIQQS
jgi:hypothetical protein